jgi:hypothetical protein
MWVGRPEGTIDLWLGIVDGVDPLRCEEARLGEACPSMV